MASRIKDLDTWSASVDKIDIEGIRISLLLKVGMTKQITNNRKYKITITKNNKKNK